MSLRHLPIGNKLNVLLLLFVLGLTAYVGFVYRVAHQVGDNTRLAGGAFPLLLLIGDCGRLTAAMRDDYTVAVTSQDSDMLEGARSRAAEAKAVIARLTEGAAASGVDVTALGAAFNAYARAADTWASETINGAGAQGQAQSRLYELSQRQKIFTRQLEDSRQQIYTTFESRLGRIADDADRTWQVGLLGGIALSLMVLGLHNFVIRRLLLQPLHRALAATARITEGHWDEAVPTEGRDEPGRLLQGLEILRVQLRARREADRHEEAQAAIVNELNLQMRGDLNARQLCERVIRYLTPALGCQIGLIYLSQGHALQPAAAYALRLDGIEPVAPGQSLVGQVIRSGKATIIDELPADYCRTIDCGSLSLSPRSVAIVPVLHNGELLAVLELGSLHRFDEELLEQLARCNKHFAVVLKVALSRQRQGSMESPRRAAVAP